ncbi:3194_t:CDS:1 [Funneliformis caledonium]|uniref:3194_t:CDS:1 n=1 Tax=Funneliformis caledonium TaxID=1117310 RepID=A0A9N8Z7M1_9GLOM|nr:3194_t:CDS:1 [Funneliformis caledonium]
MFHGDIPKIVISASLFEGEVQGQNHDINNEGSSEINLSHHHSSKDNNKLHKKSKRHKRPRNIPKIIITSESDDEKDSHSHKSCTINSEKMISPKNKNDSNDNETNTNGTSGFDCAFDETQTTALKKISQSQIKQFGTFDSESSETTTLNESILFNSNHIKQQHEEKDSSKSCEIKNEIVKTKNLPQSNTPNKESKIHKMIRYIKKKPPYSKDKKRLKVICRNLFSDKRNIHNVRSVTA